MKYFLIRIVRRMYEKFYMIRNPNSTELQAKANCVIKTNTPITDFSSTYLW